MAIFLMGERKIKEIREELERLMLQQVDMLKKQAFVGRNEKESREQQELLKRIREVSADYLAALKRTNE
ncbi:MAG: hypothetical protein WCB11_25065 [Terriglobales bacterium]